MRNVSTWLWRAVPLNRRSHFLYCSFSKRIPLPLAGCFLDAQQNTQLLRLLCQKEGEPESQRAREKERGRWEMGQQRGQQESEYCYIYDDTRVRGCISVIKSARSMCSAQKRNEATSKWTGISKANVSRQIPVRRTELREREREREGAKDRS